MKRKTQKGSGESRGWAEVVRFGVAKSHGEGGKHSGCYGHESEQRKRKARRWGKRAVGRSVLGSGDARWAAKIKGDGGAGATSSQRKGPVEVM
jgi:hypothetical protein